MRRVLITGGTGFVGSHAVEEFLRRGWTVRALIRDPQRLRWLSGHPVEFAAGTLTDVNSLERAVENCDVVVHCAGLTKAFRAEQFFQVNADSVGSLAAAAQRQGIRRFVYCSSQAASGPTVTGSPRREDEVPLPVSTYGRSKLEGERRLVENAGTMQWVIVRPPAIIGPRDEQFLPLFRAVARWGVYPVFGSGEQSYSFVCVHDLVRALSVISKAELGVNDVYFVAHHEPLDWTAAAKQIAEFAGRARAKPIRFHRGVLRLTALLCEAAARWRRKPALLSREKIQEILTTGWLCDGSKMCRVFGFDYQYSSTRTIGETYQHYHDVGLL